jgi:transposase
MGRPRKYSDELRRRAIDEVVERDRKVPEVAKQLGITTPETLRRWVVQARIDRGLVTGPTTEELAEIKALRREVADSARRLYANPAPTDPGRGPPEGCPRDGGHPGRIHR